MLTKRLVTALFLLAAFIAGLYWLPFAWWAAALLPLLAIGSWEWSRLAAFGHNPRLLFTGIVLASALLLGFTGSHFDPLFRANVDQLIYAASGAFWLFVAVPWLVLGWRGQASIAMGVTGWIVLVPAWLALAQLQAHPGKLLAVLGILWISDTAAYLAGSTWGKHKLAPHISPGKTWEGVAGAAAGVAVYYVALSIAIPEWSWWKGFGGAILFAGVAVAGVLGDLFESWIKRQAGAKDSGTLLPGHGGVLDRIDSIAAGLPIAALLLPHVG
jgi:phosphatidate cytidylyltransferase